MLSKCRFLSPHKKNLDLIRIFTKIHQSKHEKSYPPLNFIGLFGFDKFTKSGLKNYTLGFVSCFLLLLLFLADTGWVCCCYVHRFVAVSWIVVRKILHLKIVNPIIISSPFYTKSPHNGTWKFFLINIESPEPNTHSEFLRWDKRSRKINSRIKTNDVANRPCNCANKVIL